ncbi:MAG TPA: ferritin-like domain-containing protein [Myxococcota bacterium]|nr:ferritin-like domain-containing protein [Myxococcota bacterium]
MRRFIAPDELARDARFVRSRSRNELLRSLPDDVDTVVRVLEQVAPKLRERVAGTALEPVYDELGPGFAFLVTADRSGRRERSPLQLRVQLHGIFVGELQALEAAGRTLWDYPDAPWEFKMNMARQCWDEARHVQVYEKLIEHVGGSIGEFPENTFLFEASCVDDPALRVTGVNRCLEGLACDAFRSLIDYARAEGDALMAQAIDFVLADELTHVRFGSEWVKQFTAGDPERAQRAREFQTETERRFNFGGGREIARDERLEAGFSEAELDELDAIVAEGPSRATLVRAAEILREKWQARRA